MQAAGLELVNGAQPMHLSTTTQHPRLELLVYNPAIQAVATEEISGLSVCVIPSRYLTSFNIKNNLITIMFVMI